MTEFRCRAVLCLLSAATAALLSCAKGPTDKELSTMLGNNGFTLDWKVSARGRPHKVQGEMIFPVTVDQRYIIPGHNRIIPFLNYRDSAPDVEFHVVTEYLIGKDNFGAWSVVDTRSIRYEQAGSHWRPASVSMQDFYRGQTASAPSTGSAKSGAQAVGTAEQTSGNVSVPTTTNAARFNRTMEARLQKLEAKAAQAGLQGEVKATFDAQVAKARALMQEMAQIPESYQTSIRAKVVEIQGTYVAAKQILK